MVEEQQASLNAAKTQLMDVNCNQTEGPNAQQCSRKKLNLEIRGRELDVVMKANYLGTHVDNSLD